MNIFGYTFKKKQNPVCFTEEEKEFVYQSNFGKEFWDDPHFSAGYRGYQYDGRWAKVAQSILDHYQLPQGAHVLDVGCGKGFLLFELWKIRPDLQITGLDISEYALENSKPEVKDRLIQGTAASLPFKDKEFDLVISLATVYDLHENDARKAVKEIERTGKKKLIQVAAYTTPEEKENLMKNDIGRTQKSVDEWKTLYQEVGYTGDMSWFIFI